MPTWRAAQTLVLPNPRAAAAAARLLGTPAAALVAAGGRRATAGARPDGLRVALPPKTFHREPDVLLVLPRAPAACAPLPPPIGDAGATGGRPWRRARRVGDTHLGGGGGGGAHPVAANPRRRAASGAGGAVKGGSQGGGAPAAIVHRRGRRARWSETRVGRRGSLVFFSLTVWAGGRGGRAWNAGG